MTWPRDTIINPFGTGGSVKVGVLNPLPIIFAPGRKITVTGAADDFTSLVGAYHAKRVKTRGNVQSSTPLPCR